MTDDVLEQGNDYFAAIETLLKAASSDEQLFHAIVNAPFRNPVFATSLDLGIVVLLLVNTAQGTIDRIALSNTPQAHGAVKMSEKPFESIKIPLGHKGNSIAEAIESGKPHYTSDWQYLFAPAMSMQAARFNQAGAGIESSYVYPLLNARDGGALIFSYYQPPSNIGSRHRTFMKHYSSLVAARLAAA